MWTLQSKTKHMRLPEKAINHYAIHEASHLISFGLYDKKPDMLFAWIKTVKARPNGSVGFGFKSEPTDKTHIENRMLTCLAGACGESTLLEKLNSKPVDDEKDWEKTARDYLHLFNNDFPWFTHPQNKSEALVNAETLRKLKKKQWIKLKNFILLNRELVLHIAEELKTAKCNKIETEKSLSLLQKVITI